MLINYIGESERHNYKALLNEITKRLIKVTINETDKSLLVGSSGVSLYFFELYKYTKEIKYLDKFILLLKDSIENMGEFHYSFCSGSSGIAWLVEYIAKSNIIEIDTEYMFQKYDTQLLKCAIESFSKGYYDYLHGPLGVILFYLNKKQQISLGKISKIIDLLQKFAIQKSPNTIIWQEKYSDKKYLLKKRYNFSLSHGVASIISILSNVLEKDKNNTKILNMIDCSTRYILQNELKQSKSIFPSIIEDDVPEEREKLSWCYGDLGVAIALINAGNATKNSQLNRRAIEIVEILSTKDQDKLFEHTVDACFCHGVIGIAHIYHRFYNISKSNKIKKAAYYWYSKLPDFIDYTKEDLGLYNNRIKEIYKITNKIGLLEGLSGIGISLLYLLTERDDGWGNVFLLPKIK